MRFVRVIASVFLCLYGLLLLAQKEQTPEKNPLVGDPEAIAAGKKLYEEACQICHGGDARGGRGPALAAGEFLRGSEDGQIFQNIREGIAGTQMPGFDILPNEIWQLVSYIRGSVANELRWLCYADGA
jgi:mono/diheme cytochrome c family protein